jgi:hypothetical protein
MFEDVPHAPPLIGGIGERGTIAPIIVSRSDWRHPSPRHPGVTQDQIFLILDEIFYL